MDAVTRSIVAASLDASAYEAGARKVEAANQQMARSAEGVVAAGTKVEQTTMRGQRAFEAVQRELDRNFAAQQRYERAVEAINRAHERGLSSVQRHNELLELARQRYLGIGGAADGAAVQAARAATAFGGIGSRVQQAGYQLQDFVVQVQGGTSWMTALSQQGSQFLGAFGAGGAIAGVILTVGLLAARFAGLSEEVKKASDLGKEQELQLTNLTSVNALLNRELETSEERQRRLTLARRSDIAALVAQTTATEQLTIARLQEGRQMITESLSVIEARRPAGAPPLTQEQRERILGVRASEVQQIDQEIIRLSANIVTAESRLRALLDLGERTPDAGRGRRSGTSGGSRAADPELMAGWQAVQDQQRDLAAYDRQLNQEWEQEQRRRERDLEQLEERNTRVTDRIVDYSAERFADLFDENGRGWEGMLDTFERTARSTLARIAAEMVLRPVIAPVVQALGLGALGTGNGGLSGLGSLLGLGSGGTALVGGYGSGTVRLADGSVAPATGGGSGGALGSLGQYASLGRSIFSGNFSTGIALLDNPIWTAAGGWFAPSLAAQTSTLSAASTAAPWLIPAEASSAWGAMGGAANSSAGMLGNLGAASLGAWGGGIGGGFMLGSTISSMVARTPAQQTNGQIGAGAGAIGGAAIGTMIFPGVGTLVGGLLGGALGGGGGALLGPSRAFSGGDVAIGVAPGGWLTVPGAAGKNWDLAGGITETQKYVDQINDLLEAAQVSIQNPALVPWRGRQILGFQGFGESTNDLGPEALFRRVQPYLVSANANIQTAAQHVGGFEELAQAAQWITSVYEPLLNAGSATNAFAEQIKAINDNFAPAIESARKLGLAENQLAVQRDQQIADLYAQRDLSYLRGYQSIQQRQLVAQGRNYQATLLGFDVQSQDERSALIASLRDMGVTGADQAYWDRLYAYDVMRQTEQDTLVAGRNRTLGTLGTEFELRRLGALGTPESALQAFDIRANMEMEALRETLLSLGAAADDVRISMLAAAQATEREAIAKQQEQQRIGAGRDFLFDLTVGGLGGLAPEARYFAGLTAYNDARRSGDITRMTDVARGFLPVARDFLGTSERFGELTAGIGRDVAALGGDPAGLSALLDVQAGSLAAMERIANVNGLSLDELRAMRGDINRMMSTIEALIARHLRAA